MAQVIASLASRFAVFTLLTLALSATTLRSTPARAQVGVSLTGVVHLQGLGDQQLRNGQWAGTKGQARRLEGFSVDFVVPLPEVDIEYTCHLQGIGDLPWITGGKFCGTRGESRRLEGFAVRLNGSGANNFDVFYSCHLQGIGDTGPRKNGQFCGTRGQSRRLEALEIWVTRKTTLNLKGVVHLQTVGDQAFSGGTFVGTRGLSRRLEGFSMMLSPVMPDLAVEYMCHLQGIGDTQWLQNGQFCGTRGQSRRLEGMAVRLVGRDAADYQIYYGCHLQDIGDTGPVQDGQFCGTRGQSRRLEGLYVWIARRLDCSPPNQANLGVTLHPQETGMWCWAASGQMAMEFLGHNVSQCVQANNRLARNDCCTTPTPGACVQGGWPEFDRYNFTFQRTTNTALGWVQLRRELACGGRPVAFSWHWPGGGGHMMVAIGYRTVDGTNYVEVNDPWAPDVGDHRFDTYNYYVQSQGHHTHWDDFYDIRFSGVD